MNWTKARIVAVMREVDQLTGFEPRWSRLMLALLYLNWRLYPNLSPRPRRRKGGA